MHEAIAESDAQYALDLVKAICAEVGSGIPASPQERARGLVIEKELESYLGAENVSVDEFTFEPSAFLGAYPLSALFLLIAATSNWAAGNFTTNLSIIFSLVALVFSLLAPMAIILLFILNLEFLNPLLKKASSINVVGKLRRQGTQNIKRLLILSGHHDSAPANTWFRLINGLKRLMVPGLQRNTPRDDTWLRIMGIVFYFLFFTWFLGFLAMFLVSIVQVVGFIIGNGSVVRTGTLSWILLIYPVAPSIIFALFFNHGRKDGGIVPGAADNLSACAVCVAMCRFLVNHPSLIPARTEIRFISFGAEEAGLRGSRRYVEQHLDELLRLDTRVLNFETIAQPVMSIMTSEGSGSVKVSDKHVKSLVEAAERTNVPYKLTSAWMGAGSDAAPFSKAGMKATTILPFQMPQDMIAFYHQDADTPEVLRIEPLMNALKLSLEWIISVGDHEFDEFETQKTQADVGTMK